MTREDQRLTRVVVGMVLVVVTYLFIALVTSPPPSASVPTDIERQIQTAQAHCAQVWVEHKVSPALPDEVLARGCK